MCQSWLLLFSPYLENLDRYYFVDQIQLDWRYRHFRMENMCVCLFSTSSRQPGNTSTFRVGEGRGWVKIVYVVMWECCHRYCASAGNSFFLSLITCDSANCYFYCCVAPVHIQFKHRVVKIVQMHFQTVFHVKQSEMECETTVVCVCACVLVFFSKQYTEFVCEGVASMYVFTKKICWKSALIYRIRLSQPFLTRTYIDLPVCIV